MDVLSDPEVYRCYPERALMVVHMNHSLRYLLNSVDVLFKCGPHARNALVDAAPCLYFARFVLVFVHLERNWFLSYDEDRFYLHVEQGIYRVNCCLDKVLDLGFGSLTVLCVFIVERAWYSLRQLELEGHSVRARHQD